MIILFSIILTLISGGVIVLLTRLLVSQFKETTLDKLDIASTTLGLICAVGALILCFINLSELLLT